MAAVPNQNQKLHQENMTNNISVKMDDHVHFKPNIHLLSNKSHHSSGVYNVLSGQNQRQSQQQQQQQQQQQIFHPPSLFSNTIRQPTESLSSSGLRIDESAQSNASLNFNSNHDNSNVSGAFRSNTTAHAPPPQIFNASLNSANLMTSASNHNMVGNSHHNEKSAALSNQANPGYNTGIGMGSSVPVDMPTSSSGSQNSQTSSSTQQYSQSSVGMPYSQPSSGIHSHTQYSQSSYSQSNNYQNSSGNLVQLDGQQSSNGQQPTYVLLQAPNDGESGTQPQVFLAMQTPGMTGQDPQQQPYITLQPVNVDGSELSNNTLVQDGVNLQQAVMGSTEINSDGKQISTESGQQVVLSLPGQQGLIPSSSNNGQQNMVTYLQPLGGIGVPVSNMEQGQVIMASSDLQGNLTLHNVPGLSGTTKRSGVPSNRNVGLTTPRRRLSTDPRSCDQCGRCFKYPSDLKKHLQIHTDIKKFACDECPRMFRRLHQLNVHRRIHTGEKPYVCNRCSAQFRHDSTLTMHIRTRHDHLKPFTCDGCAKKFGRMSHLRKHQRNVCGRSSLRGSVVQCKYCELSFPKKSELKLHFSVCEKKPDRMEKELMSPTNYVCETCGKEFPRVYDFKRHQLSHSDEKPYGCPQCGKTFKERSSLNKHVKRMHCSEGDGTIPIDDDGIIAGDDDDEDELSGEEHERPSGLMTLSISDPRSSSSSVTAQALAQAGIITSSDGQVLAANGQAISATEILNFPEVAEALGINSGAHATVLDSDGNSTMIAITQPGNLETSEVSMDMEQNIIHDDNIISSESASTNTEQYIPSTESLNMNPVSVDSDTIDPTGDINVDYTNENNESTIYNSTSNDEYASTLGSSMVFKQEDDAQQFVKHEDLADHVKAEQAAAHDLSPEEEQPNVLTSDILEENASVLNSV